MKLTAHERERLKYINYTMNFLYEKLAAIYENMVDKEHGQLCSEISEMIKQLEDIRDESEQT